MLTCCRAAACIAAELDATSEGTPTRLPVFDFEATRAMAPLPRAYQWADGSAYLNHVELARKARGAYDAGRVLPPIR